MEGYDYGRMEKLIEFLKKGKCTMKELWQASGWHYGTLKRYVDFLEKRGKVATKIVGRGRNRRREVWLVDDKLI